MAKTIIGTISSYDYEFKGIMNQDGTTLVIPETIVGEKVAAAYNKENNVNQVENLKILEVSPHRVKPKCSIYSKCGGCHLLHIDYEQQLDMKTDYVKDLFWKNFGHVSEINHCIGMKYPFEYRNKCQVVFRNDVKNKIISGFYQEKTHKIIDFTRCYVQNENSDKIINTIKTLLIKMHLNAYDEDRKRGFVRHVMIKNSIVTSEVMVVIVTSEDIFPGKSNFVKALISKHPEITTIIQNVNPRETNAVLGFKENILYGKGYITDILCNKKFIISAQSFYQINAIQAEVLYKRAIECANITKNDIVLDAYSGVGTIGIIASDYAKKVLSVELVKSAYQDAINNAKINKISNIRFFNDDASNFIVNLANKKEKIDVLIMDPPRKGSDDKFINAILKLMPPRIIYISCNPYSQVEDIKKIISKYNITTIQPVDMFPQTNHVENIVCLTKK